MWRSKATKANGRSHYEFDGCQKIEDFKLESKLDKIQLPILSKKSVHCLAKEDLQYLEEETQHKPGE